MREIESRLVTETVARLFQQANFELGEDVLAALRQAREQEESPAGREAIDRILENAAIAAEQQVPLCQDCGVAVVFLEIGQEVHVTGGDLSAAVNEGVRRAYREGYLRASMVRPPFSTRQNTGDNTPAVIHAEIVAGERLKITTLPKGAGAENMARLAMLTPSQGRPGIIDFVVRAVAEAGSNPCPPLIIGVGIGGTSEQVMLLAKKALLRRVGEPHSDPEVAALEAEIRREVNNLGIGPMGYGGRVTALTVPIEVFPAHMGSLPVAVNIQCHAHRHKEREI
ncbi:MAG: fumarate hydratase [Chloroflexota bacterium]